MLRSMRLPEITDYSTALVYLDGENMVFRYEAMLKEGRKPKQDNIHLPGVFVWNPVLSNSFGKCRMQRVQCYSVVVGGDDKVREASKKLSEIRYKCRYMPSMEYTAQIIPRIFKKSKDSHKSRVVDISMTVDLMRAASFDSGIANAIIVVSGDGDFIPVAKEIMNSGKVCHFAAFSSGLNPELSWSVDELTLLDKVFFDE